MSPTPRDPMDCMQDAGLKFKRKPSKHALIHTALRPGLRCHLPWGLAASIPFSRARRPAHRPPTWLRPPRAPRPLALPGQSPRSGLAVPSQGPCRASRSSHRPGQAVCWPGEAPWCQVPVGPPTRHSGQHPPPPLLTLDGPRRVQGPTVCWFSSPPGAACGRVAKLLCACCTEGTLVHTALPGAQGSAGQAPPWVRGSPGQVPAGLSTQEPSTGPSLQSTPSPPVGQV